MEKHTIAYGTKEIEFGLERANRKTLGITVHPDTSVQVRAPEKTDLEKVLKRVKKRARWIKKQQLYFESFLPTTPPREYVSGETHLYLGKQYRLKVMSSDVETVKLKRGRLFVHTPTPSKTEKVKGLVGGWYKHHAENFFQKSMEKAVHTLKPYGIKEEPPLVIQRMKKRWGNCTPKGKIVLNPEIIKAPSKCIEYVLLHEMCHLVYHHHGKEFYRLQQKVMPDWKHWKTRLEQIMV